MNIKSILKFIRSALKVNWARSIYFNLKYLPFKQAKYLPILLYHPASIKGKGIVVLNVNKENIMTIISIIIGIIILLDVLTFLVKATGNASNFMWYLCRPL